MKFQTICIFTIVLAMLVNNAYSTETVPAPQNTESPSVSTPSLPVGDGVTDDTAAIQALLDSRSSLVYLPPPSKYYLISRALVIHSNQTLKLDPLTRIRLADNAEDYMLVNDDRVSGNKNIRVIGGIWDGNNLNQSCIYHEDGTKRAVNVNGDLYYVGNVLFLMNVEHLFLEQITIKDPETFGILLAKVRYFTVKDIVFDYNLELVNEDGIHICGPARNGLIQNVKGNTNDDFVALNADDAWFCEVSRGPITDVRIDGLFCLNGYTAVRMLSAGNPVKRVHISNIFGTFRAHLITFTHHDVHPKAPSFFQDIHIDHIYFARQMEPGPAPEKEVRLSGIRNKDKLTPEEAQQCTDGLQPWWENFRKTQPFIWIQTGATVENLSISDICRREFLSGTKESITIDKNAKVSNLSLRGIVHQNNTDVVLPFLSNEGTIECITVDDVNLSGLVQPLIGSGKILKSDDPRFPESQQQ